MDQKIAAELVGTAKKLASPGKGILAADESTGTIKKRFDGIGVENTEQNRADYRELLFKTKGLGDHISGAILFEETLYQKTSSGEAMADILKSANIVIGIKVDKGVVNLPLTDEPSTQGLDGLGARCQGYYNAGARFAKWRAVLSIDSKAGKPSQLSIQETAHTLARYAAICQESGLVPIVEPEILCDGPHDIEMCAEVTTRVLAAQFKALHDHRVLLEGCLLKPNMVTAGSECSIPAKAAEVAFYTVRSLRRTVPPCLGGIFFLSGGQSEEDASLNLNAINNQPNTGLPMLSFSYGRALQATVLKTWGGKTDNVAKAQEALMTRAKANGEAQLGKYSGGAAGSNDSLHVKNYIY